MQTKRPKTYKAYCGKCGREMLVKLSKKGGFVEVRSHCVCNNGVLKPSIKQGESNA